FSCPTSRNGRNFVAACQARLFTPRLSSRRYLAPTFPAAHRGHPPPSRLLRSPVTGQSAPESRRPPQYAMPFAHVVPRPRPRCGPPSAAGATEQGVRHETRVDPVAGLGAATANRRFAVFEHHAVPG